MYNCFKKLQTAEHMCAISTLVKLIFILLNFNLNIIIVKESYWFIELNTYKSSYGKCDYITEDHIPNSMCELQSFCETNQGFKTPEGGFQNWLVEKVLQPQCKLVIDLASFDPRALWLSRTVWSNNTATQVYRPTLPTQNWEMATEGTVERTKRLDHSTQLLCNGRQGYLAGPLALLRYPKTNWFFTRKCPPGRMSGCKRRF